jgi:hypothetical protein
LRILSLVKTDHGYAGTAGPDDPRGIPLSAVPKARALVNVKREMAQLPDAQLDAKEMAKGIRECWGLPEWDLVRSWH